MIDLGPHDWHWEPDLGRWRCARCLWVAYVSERPELGRCVGAPRRLDGTKDQDMRGTR